MTFLSTLLAVFFTLSCVAQENFKTYTAPDGINIVYEDSGSGEALLLLHGFINTGDNWRRTDLYKKLRAEGFRVIVPDMRGNGLSDKPHADKYYQDNAEVTDLVGIISQAGIKEYTVVGYSRGSIVAAKLLKIDKRVTKAVLGGMGEEFTDPNWDRRIMFGEAFSGKAHLHPEAAGAISYAKSINSDTLALGFLQKFQPVTTQKQLSKVKLPVLVLCGDQDRDNGDPAVLVSYFKNGKLSIVPGIHNTTYHSAAFADEVMAFIK